MNHRCLAAVLTLVGVVAFAPVFAAAQSTETTAPPRTPWGAPDLQGVWDFRSITPFERPEELADKEFLTEEEAANIEKEAIDRNKLLLDRPAQRAKVTENVDRGEDGAPGHYNNFWIDKGTNTVGTRRTSLVVDPPNGKMPPLTPSAEQKKATLEMKRQGLSMHEVALGGWLEDLGAEGLQLRCITGFNAGPPMTPGYYNNNVQLFQTPRLCGVAQRDEPQRPRRLAGRTGARRPPSMDGRLPWPLGGRYACRGDDEVPARDELCLRTNRRATASHRTLHAGFFADIDVPSHD